MGGRDVAEGPAIRGVKPAVSGAGAGGSGAVGAGTFHKGRGGGGGGCGGSCRGAGVVLSALEFSSHTTA